ncbi:methionyl-tRNA formyltransferase [Breznakiellaceae bacterium SP9]
MRVLFAGSPDIAVPCLKALLEPSSPDVELVGVLTNPDSSKGRRGKSEATPVGTAAVQAFAGRANPPALLKPERLDAAAREAVTLLKPELLISFAYGRIFGPRFLALFPQGGINVHPSLLPKYRGSSPIPAAIRNREAETGISIQHLSLELDAGDIVAQERIVLAGRETTESLCALVADRSAQMVPAVLHNIIEGNLQKVPQNNAEATYCPLISKEDGKLDWSQSAARIDAQIRAYTPWPLCYTKHGEQSCFILEGNPYQGPLDKPNQGAQKAVPAGLVLGAESACGILIQTGDGVFAATKLQFEAKKALFWKDFLNGARGFIGALLT